LLYKRTRLDEKAQDPACRSSLRRCRAVPANSGRRIEPQVILVIDVGSSVASDLRRETARFMGLTKTMNCRTTTTRRTTDWRRRRRRCRQALAENLLDRCSGSARRAGSRMSVIPLRTDDRLRAEIAVCRGAQDEAHPLAIMVCRDATSTVPCSGGRSTGAGGFPRRCARSGSS